MAKKFSKKKITYIFFRSRMTAFECQQHIWLTDRKQCSEIVLSKTKLKRYVIQRRWIKVVNTIVALQRMGAKIGT